MYYILSKQSLSPTAVVHAPSTLAEIQLLLPMSSVDRLWAIDLETRGVDASDPNSIIVGIGFSDGNSSFYIQLLPCDNDILDYVSNFLVAARRLTAFNVMFDAAFLYKFTGKWLAWEGCSYGMFKQLSGEGHKNQRFSLEVAQLTVLGWSSTNKAALDSALKERGLTKADMWLLPVSVLGPYCALDAEAAFQLWNYFTSVCRERDFSGLVRYHRDEFLTMCRLLIEQQLRGISVDKPKLVEYSHTLGEAAVNALAKFMVLPPVVAAMDERIERIKQEYVASEPARFNKGGEESVRWQKWSGNKDAYVRKHRFNANSKLQLAWLFYEALGNKVILRTPKGSPAVSKKVLPALGEPGKQLAKFNKLTKELSYVMACIGQVRDTGIAHPQFRWPGTLTGRPAGSGKFNWLQQPKTRGYLECMTARTGYKLIQLDAEALEPTILAEFSGDAALMRIYGEGVPQNDIYLYTACFLGKLGAEIRKYYDPENPTPTGIDAAKERCKHERGIAKIVVLSANYQAGPRKIHETLSLGGVDITLNEVMRIHRDYWQLYAGVKQFEQDLKNMWYANDGWIVNGFGRPICVSVSKLKDILNRFCQSTASDFLAVFVREIYLLADAEQVPIRPWLVNFYDETIGEVEERYAEQAADIYRRALAATNVNLGMGIKLKGGVVIANTLADIKVGK